MEPIDYKNIKSGELIMLRQRQFRDSFTHGSFSPRSLDRWLRFEGDLAIWECWMLGVFKPEPMDPDFPDKPFFQCYTEDQLRILYNKRSAQVSELNFRDELRSLINRHSMENGSNTPDFILADYLQGCLELFDKSILSREGYFGTKRAT